MAVFLFPYEKIEKDSNIILWGAGNVGTSYVRQLFQIGYCNIVAWVDKNYLYKESRYLAIENPEIIKETIFDYVVVAINEPRHATNVMRTLSEWGIPDDKVVWVNKRYHAVVESPMSYNDIKNGNSTMDELLMVYKRGNIRNLDFFRSIIMDYADDEESGKTCFCKMLKDYFLTKATADDLAILTRLMITIRFFDADCLKYGMEQVAYMSTFEKRYWQAVQLFRVEFFYPYCIYDDYYLDKRNVYDMLAKEFIPDMEKLIRKCPTESENNVVIMTQYLHGVKESLSHMVSDYANELYKQGEQVHICLTEPTFYSYGEADILPETAITLGSDSYQIQISEYIDEGVNVHFTPTTNVRERIAFVLKKIIELQPKYIIDMTAKHSFLNAVLIDFYPIICISTGNNCNGAKFDKYVCKEKQACLMQNERFRSVMPDQIMNIPIGAKFPMPKFEYKRADYGLEDEDFVLISVGNRLRIEMSEELIDLILVLLKRYSKIKWVIVGTEIPYIIDKYKEFIENGQIIYWGYEEDLPSLYKLCNVYVNPNREGGGYSVTWAVGMGVPVAATDYPSDALGVLGELALHGGYDMLVQSIEKMYLQPDYYNECIEKTKLRSEQCSFSKRIKCLIEECDLLAHEKSVR